MLILLNVFMATINACLWWTTGSEFSAAGFAISVATIIFLVALRP